MIGAAQIAGPPLHGRHRLHNPQDACQVPRMGPIEAKAIILVASVFAGTACIYMGFRLMLAGIGQRGSAEASGAGFSVAWAGYGPGVAFALFGALLIGFAVTRDLVSEYERVSDPIGILTERGRIEAAASRLSTTDEESPPPPK